MDRKKIYFFSLVGFFLMWGVFGFVAAVPRGEPDLRVTVSSAESTAVISEGIPVTGEPEPLWTEILGFYGSIGLAALFLILGLLNFANKSTALSAKHKEPPPEETHQK